MKTKQLLWEFFFRFAVFGEIKLPIFENLGYEQLGEFDKNKNFSC